MHPSASPSIVPPADVHSPGIVALSRFVVANGMEAEVKAAFRRRPHLVDQAAGHRRMEVLSPVTAPPPCWP